MSKLNLFALFGVLFLSSILLGSGTFLSNNTSILAQENEAEVEVDIEQENKCKKDTECENENEINNSLTITTTQGQEEQPETPETCETCFTDILSEEQLTSFIAAFGDATDTPFTSIEDVCAFIDEFDVGEDSGILDQDIFDAAFGTNGVTNGNQLTTDQYDALIQCLQDAGLDVAIPTPI